MEFNEVIQNRRSIRHFTLQEVEQDKVDQLIDCARLCQSAKNRQPWSFMILKGQEKNKVADMMMESSNKESKEIFGYVNTVKYSAEIIKRAPLLIAVFQVYEEEWFASDLLSTGAAIEHICLECVNLGLGSVWIGDIWFNERAISKYLGCDHLHLISAVAIGYPAETPKPRPRKSREEILLSKKL
ncbi:MAG: nitroreductase family protein [Beduini sp.]|uniref:nitroreductase family protein n=1 Tax=Beduini sp. TaxID=1922300 RepID=UPI0039A1D19B